MPLRLDATIELSDAQLAQIADHLAGLSADLGRGDPELAPRARQGPRPRWRLVEERHGVTYAWPEETDTYEPFRVYEGDAEGGSIRLAIGECERAMVRGSLRKYFITGHVAPSGAFRPIAEFLATDDHEQTRQTIAIIKGKGGSARMYDPSDRLPVAYEGFQVETYRDRVDKPHSYSKLGVLAGEDDVDTMLGHTYIQAVSRLGIRPG